MKVIDMFVERDEAIIIGSCCAVLAACRLFLYLKMRRWGPRMAGSRCTTARVCVDLRFRFVSQSVPHTVAPWPTSSPRGAAWWRWRRTGTEWCDHTCPHAITHSMSGGKGWVLDERSRVHVERCWGTRVSVLHLLLCPQKTDHLEHILDTWDVAKQGSRPKVRVPSRALARALAPPLPHLCPTFAPRYRHT